MERNSATTASEVTTEVKSPRQKLVLKLKKKSNITWSEDTVDNENLGRKTSKRCCIFHKNKVFGESDSDESDSDTEVAKNATPPQGRPKNYQRHHA
jgi:protein phosphatase 1 regulatory subunit 11